MSGVKDIQLTDNSIMDSVDMDLHEKGLNIDEEYSGRVIVLGNAVECDGFAHYIIPPASWKDNVEEGREVKEGEYQYWTHASWSSAKIWDSVRDSIAYFVAYVEEMVEMGERVDDGFYEMYTSGEDDKSQD
jgi:hypothetical protein